MKANPVQRFSSSSIPRGMTMIQYTGSNVGSQTWAGPGEVPSGRYYIFGNNPKDKVKFVDARDVAWFTNLRDEGRNVFVLYKEPAVQKVEQKVESVLPIVTAEEAELDTLPTETFFEEPVAVAELGPEPVEIVKPVDPADFFKTKKRGRPKSGSIK